MNDVMLNDIREICVSKLEACNVKDFRATSVTPSAMGCSDRFVHLYPVLSSVLS